MGDGEGSLHSCLWYRDYRRIARGGSLEACLSCNDVWSDPIVYIVSRDGDSTGRLHACDWAIANPLESYTR